MKTALPIILVLLIVPAALSAPVPESDYGGKPKPDTRPVVVLQTSLGAIKIELFRDKAPITVANFLAYVDAKHYDGLVFHRVIPNFMIQGGGLTPDLKDRPAKAPIKNESVNGLSNVRGTLAVARAVNPDSGTCQFFINLKDNIFLDRARAHDRAGYCVFGKVIEGMEVVDKIAGVPTAGRGQHQDVPVQPVVIQSVRRVKK